MRLAPKAFEERWSIPFLQAKFDARGLRAEIDHIVEDRTLDSHDLLTGLAIISKRIDTGSPWIMANNPMSKFWEAGKDSLANKDHPLATLVRASTAAPLYFDPQIIPITRNAPVDPLGEVAAPFSGAPWHAFFASKLRALYGLVSRKGPSKETHGLFIDGGVTPYNNPSMALLMLMTLKQHGICWKPGPENLTIVSIGTGSFRTKITFSELGFAGPVKLAKQAMLSSIGDAQKLAVAQMQWLGDCPIRWPVDSEIEGVEGNPPPGGPWFRFMRYDVDLSTMVDLQQMDKLAVIEPLYDTARRAAADQMKPEHLFGGPAAPDSLA